jgi:sodium/bile acid cotransporter 7
MAHSDPIAMSAAPRSAYRRHGFTLCLFGVVVLASVYPEPAAPEAWLRPEWTTKIGVWIIFLLQGISLPLRELAAGYRPLRLQAFVLGWNFLIFPLVTFLSLVWLTYFLPPDVVLGFGLLSILPTTIASAVAFTSLAGGRTASALCATVLSNMLAVVVVPLWVSFYLRTGESVELPLVPLLSKLALLIVFPVLLGQLLRLYWKGLAEWARSWVRGLSSAIILYIVYVAFAGSVASGFAESLSAFDLTLIFFEVTALLLIVSAAVWFSAGWLGLTSGERIAAFFCASQKSLATGLPLATAIFAVLPATIGINVGAVLLPLIAYHPLQLLLAAVCAERVSK